MQENSTFNLRTNRFGNVEMVEKRYSCIQLKRNMKSIHLSDKNFTNFTSSMGSSKYKKVKEIYRDFTNNTDIINKYFQPDELINEKEKIQRLKSIIEKNIGEELTIGEIINNVQKFKCIDDKEIQFYFYYKNNILNLILVDLYHLGIFAQKNGRYIWQAKYNKAREYKCCLSNIVRN